MAIARSILQTPAAKVLRARIRKSAMLAEDILPYGIHDFDRHQWVLKETNFGVRIWCSLDERPISRPILLNAYETAEMHFIARNLKPGQLAIDAGANLGFHGLHLAKIAGSDGFVELFEPLPYLARALTASVEENSFQKYVHVRALALDERPGHHALRHAPRTENFDGAHLAPPTKLSSEAHADVLVETVRLDDIVGDRLFQFIKIDVEGAEPRVIRGGMKTISNGHRRFCQKSTARCYSL